MPGRQAEPCGWPRIPPIRPIPRPRRSPATGSGCPSGGGCCCAEPALRPAEPDRGVDGRPVSPVTCALLAWAAEHLAAEGVRVLALVRDNASWHISREVRAWIRDHDRRVKAVGSGCRLLACRLPSRSPWLN